ncbi:uncharacterized protein [Rutidosis leptorrhynchoides]|uniref:uncharacterized protein n=1 Tax=Rutidosis leptorrhynchoides TaxID=125765 RepID=UPI003A9A263C
MQVDIDDWLVCGDFNEVRKASERKNCVFFENRAKLFNDFIEKTCLIEIPLGGSKFTRISDDGIKYSKLDRFLASEKFSSTWEGLSATTLAKEHSDHFPIMLKDTNTDFGPKSTRVFDNWLVMADSPDVISSSWGATTRNPKPGCIFRDKLKNFKEALKTKCNSQFKKLNSDIDTLKYQVKNWEKTICLRDLIEDEIAQWMETKKIWFQKDKENAEILKQKSRIKWAVEGDESSKYFHSIIRRRTTKNNIRGINMNGIWQENPNIIKNEALSHFKSRFSASHHRTMKFRGQLEHKLSYTQADIIESPFNEAVIFEAMKDCGSSKAPGPDGFNMKFVKIYWNIIKNKLIRAVNYL